MPRIKIVFTDDFLSCQTDRDAAGGAAELDAWSTRHFPKFATYLVQLEGLEVPPLAFAPAFLVPYEQKMSRRHPLGFWAFIGEFEDFETLPLPPDAAPGDPMPVLARMHSEKFGIDAIVICLTRLGERPGVHRLGFVWAGRGGAALRYDGLLQSSRIPGLLDEIVAVP